ncbi:MAG: VanZ family protein [Patescibacteria group bacterium]|nr:VanZ family protein [Patescibacteria group bacterium]
MKRKIFNWSLVAVWILVIFYFSSQPDLKSSLPNLWDLIFRKIAHILEFTVLTYFLIKAFSNYNISKKNIFIFSFVAAVVFSISDEFHQSFIQGRCGAIKDVFIDFIGVALCLIIYKKSNL